jgi:hypothetical protein
MEPRPAIGVYLALLLCVAAATMSAQKPAERPRCLTLHISLNGKPLDGPQVVTFTAKQSERTVSIHAGCFVVPPALLAEKVAGIRFTTAANKIDLAGISTDFFSGSWDIDLEDKKFRKEVSLPKNARAKEACAVVFHDGSEPERGLSQTGCRAPAL